MKDDQPAKWFESLDQAYLHELRRVLACGDGIAPRQLSTLERTDSVLRFSNPRNRLVRNRARRWSLHYAIGELLWHLSGSNDLEFIAYYSDVWRKFTEDGLTISGSCYGHKLFGKLESGTSRWEAAKRLLERDRDTRRCVITLYDLTELSAADVAKDMPCCNMLQFLVRDGKLCLSVYMRSNDLMYGFVYDIFLLTMLQELMATQLGLPIGWYQHAAGSLHVYDRDVKWARRIAAESFSPGASMPAMTHPEELSTTLEYEKRIRLADEVDPMMQFEVATYWENMLVALLFHKLRRLGEHDDAIVAARRLDGTCFESVIDVFL